MDPLTLTEIAEMAGARVLKAGDALITSVSKDSRTAGPGDLYVALRGANFDGNDFAADALARGAAAVLVDSTDTASRLDGPVLLAEDGRASLQRLAGAWRQKLLLKAVGITGSSGKTSTKEFAAGVLGTRYRVVKTAGNLNNHIGVPLSILAASKADRAAVWEVGMNHAGEIAPLAALCRPDIAIITNIGVAHIENLGSRDAIAVEKGSLAEAVGPRGVVILSADDDKSDSIACRCRARVVRTGISGGQISAASMVESDTGCHFDVIHEGDRFPARIPANGEHMVRNALLALAAGLEMDVPLEEGISGLAGTHLASGRQQRRNVGGVIFLDDTYNANPDSMEAALKMLRALPGAGRRIAVLGMMGELGSYAAEGYERTGRAAAVGADILVTVGREAAAAAAAARAAGLGRIHEVADTASAALMLKNLARPGDLVLVKGSRAARMEAVIEHFQG
jgi:UDP-N-acetylmuramoyl-tripeptide--D-alanyl-D-alanine ligase